MRAIFALEDGSVFIGSHFGATGTEVGEACFNTSMTGYQEVLTDPSYSGQIVTMTYPLIGNYGINPEDNESAGAQVSGFVVAELAKVHSNWRATEALGPWLERQGVIGIEGVDTRKIAKHLRSAGAMRACLTTELTPEEAVEAARKAPSMEGCNIVDKIGSHPMTPEEVDALVTEGEMPPVEYDIVAFDFGIKYNILRQLRENGFRVTVVPAHTTAEEVLAMKPDGVFLSNGPGGPRHADGHSPRGSRLDREGPHVRHLPGAPDHFPRSGGENLQAEVRPPRRQPSGEGPPHGQNQHHVPEPRFCRGPGHRA